MNFLREPSPNCSVLCQPLVVLPGPRSCSGEATQEGRVPLGHSDQYPCATTEPSTPVLGLLPRPSASYLLHIQEAALQWPYLSTSSHCLRCTLLKQKERNEPKEKLSLDLAWERRYLKRKIREGEGRGEAEGRSTVLEAKCWALAKPGRTEPWSWRGRAG